MRCFFCILLWIFSLPTWVHSDTPKPIYIGLDAEFGVEHSTSAQAVERGILIAIDEINRSGGVLGGRPLVLKTTDNRSVTARGIRNLRKLAEIPDLVAVFGARFSPVVLGCVPVAHELGLILLVPWAAADAIVDNGRSPSFVFRLSLRDGLAMPFMLRFALSKAARHVGLLVPNTAWGRSNVAAAEEYYRQDPLPRNVATAWYNWGDQTMVQKYHELRLAGADAIIFVANDAEAAVLVQEMTTLADDQLMPIVSHWGVTGGRFADLVGPAIERFDYSVVQTFSFFTADKAKVERVLSVAERLFGISRIEEIASPVGVGHAYDLTHILAQAIELAGSSNRAAIRDALERVENYDGLVKFFPRPFTPSNHEALGEEDIFMARYQADGTIRPIDAKN